MMMALGMFVFNLETLVYQELQRKTAWKHPSASRVGARDAHQFTGPGDDTITLPGVLLPQLAGTRLSLDALREMGNSGKAWVLVDGTGRVYGAWVILDLAETASLFFADGAPRRIEFTLSLKRVDDDRVDMAAMLGTLASSLTEAFV
jgi:hypothetical protein